MRKPQADEQEGINMLTEEEILAKYGPSNNGDVEDDEGTELSELESMWENDM